MATRPPPPPEVTRTRQEVGERSLEDMAERIPKELLTAEDSHVDGLDELEHDPFHFLRRACQDVDYGPPPATPAEGPHAPG